MKKIYQFKAHKLVRDKIPTILRAAHIIVNDRVLSDGEYPMHLKNKLLEETQECLHTKTHDELLEKLADLYEVMITLAHAHGFSMHDVEKKRIDKKNHKGGFAQKIYVTTFAMEEDNPQLPYYHSKPEQYPEIEK